jgi:hypothetical protein
MCMCLAFSTHLDHTLPARPFEFTDVGCHSFVHLFICYVSGPWGHFLYTPSGSLYEVLLWQSPAVSEH